MTKKELVNILYHEAELNKRQANLAINAIVTAIQGCVSEYDRCHIPGSFEGYTE